MEAPGAAAGINEVNASLCVATMRQWSCESRPRAKAVNRSIAFSINIRSRRNSFIRRAKGTSDTKLADFARVRERRPARSDDFIDVFKVYRIRLRNGIPVHQLQVGAARIGHNQPARSSVQERPARNIHDLPAR